MPEASENYQIQDTGFWRLGEILLSFLLAWPLYLLNNFLGKKFEVHADHFNPYSPYFSKRERFWIVVSDVALVFMLSFLQKLGESQGWLWLTKANPSIFLSLALHHFSSRFWRLIKIDILQSDRHCVKQDRQIKWLSALSLERPATSKDFGIFELWLLWW